MTAPHPPAPAARAASAGPASAPTGATTLAPAARATMTAQKFRRISSKLRCCVCNLVGTLFNTDELIN